LDNLLKTKKRKKKRLGKRGKTRIKIKAQKQTQLYHLQRVQN
jgi:hypothetical protein